MYDRVMERARALAADVPVVRLAQPVDLRRFTPHGPWWIRRAARSRSATTCAATGASSSPPCARQAGLELRFVGVHDGSSAAPEHELNTADIVIGKARAIVEAMACGRAAYVYDHNGGDGWITPETYERHAADNFAGQSTK